MLIDIHTHTYPTSDDSELTPEELISEAKRIGLDGICLTDHDGFWDPGDVEKLGKDNDYLVIPGCEVTTEEGHLLVYGLSEYIFGMHKSSFVHELVEEAGDKFLSQLHKSDAWKGQTCRSPANCLACRNQISKEHAKLVGGIEGKCYSRGIFVPAHLIRIL